MSGLWIREARWPVRARAFSLFLVTLIVAACGPAAAAPSSPAAGRTPSLGADVIDYRGNAGRTGVMPGPGPSGTVSVRWTFQAGGPIASQPAVHGSTIYVVSTDGMLHDVDLATGMERWAVAIGAESHGSPSVVKDLVIVPADDGAHAFAAADGKVVWTSTAMGQVRGTPAIVGDLAVFSSSSGKVTAVDVATGAIRWTTDIGGPDDSSVAAADGTVILGRQDGIVIALTITDGKPRWRVDLGDGARLGTPAIADGRVFLASLDGGPDGSRHISALDLVTGMVLWRFASPGDRPAYTPAIAGGRAITEGEDGSVTALDEAKGTVLWQTKAPGGLVEIVPSISGGMTYGASNDGYAFGMDAATGLVRWQVPIRGVPYGAAITSGLMLVGTNVGNLYAIGGSGS
jgi:outer membrane protein assembly factor BamB